jgi:hypothetical protein
VSYAARTSVAPAKTRTDIEHQLEKRGASQFGFNRDGRLAVIMFTLEGLKVRLELVMPDPEERRFTHTAQGRRRIAGAHAEAYDQEVRRRWRALLLVVKAKLVAVDEGITTLEREFLADVVLETGQTVIEAMRPSINGVKARAMLPAPEAADV